MSDAREMCLRSVLDDALGASKPGDYTFVYQFRYMGDLWVVQQTSSVLAPWRARCRDWHTQVEDGTIKGIVEKIVSVCDLHRTLISQFDEEYRPDRVLGAAKVVVDDEGRPV